MKPPIHFSLSETSLYLVVCANGFVRGQFDKPIAELETCAKLRNSLCVCGGRHRIIRVEQVGDGREIE